MEKNVILSLKNVSKTFPVGKSLLGRPTKFVHAVNDVSFDVYESLLVSSPVISMILSASVDLPWSIWAMMQKFLILL